MVSAESMNKFYKLREDLFKQIDKALEEDGHHKSYEGTLEITCCYPNRFEENGENKPNYWVIELHCYVIGPSRHYDWDGKTFEEALFKADKEIREWFNDYSN